MSETNKNNSMDAILGALNKVNAVQESAQEKTNTTSNQSNEDRLKNYFTTNLPDGITSGTKRFRIIPMPNGEFVEVVSFHNVKVGKFYRKLFDPAQEGNTLWSGERKVSPLNDLRKTLYQSGNEEDKKEAKKYFTKIYFILKGVEIDDNGNIVDGQPKFWRIPINTKGEGTMDKIRAHISREVSNGNQSPIWDYQTGKTLELELKKVENPMKKGTYYTKVTSVFLDSARPVTSDAELMQKLQNDEKIWSDVYSIKPESFLRVLADGENPVWSKEKGDYVAESASTSEGSASMSDADEYTASQTNESINTPTPTPTANIMESSVESHDIDDDDLPF